jgi:hypothetical protein
MNSIAFSSLWTTAFPTVGLHGLCDRRGDDLNAQFFQLRLGPTLNEQRNEVSQRTSVECRVGVVDQLGHRCLRHGRILLGEPVDNLANERPLADLNHSFWVASLTTNGQAQSAPAVYGPPFFVPP